MKGLSLFLKWVAVCHLKREIVPWYSFLWDWIPKQSKTCRNKVMKLPHNSVSHLMRTPPPENRRRQLSLLASHPNVLHHFGSLTLILRNSGCRISNWGIVCKTSCFWEHLNNSLSPVHQNAWYFAVLLKKVNKGNQFKLGDTQGHQNTWAPAQTRAIQVQNVLFPWENCQGWSLMLGPKGPDIGSAVVGFLPQKTETSSTQSIILKQWLIIFVDSHRVATLGVNETWTGRGCRGAHHQSRCLLG